MRKSKNIAKPVLTSAAEFAKPDSSQTIFNANKCFARVCKLKLITRMRSGSTRVNHATFLFSNQRNLKLLRAARDNENPSQWQRNLINRSCAQNKSCCANRSSWRTRNPALSMNSQWKHEQHPVELRRAFGEPTCTHQRREWCRPYHYINE